MMKIEKISSFSIHFQIVFYLVVKNVTSSDQIASKAVA
jgi:hypothetical protein